MSAVHDFPIDDLGKPVGCEEDTLSAQWAAMHRAADAIAKMLGQDSGSDRTFSLYPAGLPQDRSETLDVATGDLCAIMEQGLVAILRARENGAEAKVAAKALLRRFESGRRTLLAEAESQTEEDLAA